MQRKAKYKESTSEESIESESSEERGPVDVVIPEEDTSEQEVQSLEEIDIPQGMLAETVEPEP